MPTVVTEFVGWLGWSFTAVYACLICYYHWLLNKLPRFSVPVDFVPCEKVTVLVPARNEEDSIGACLQSILANDYPAHLLEIIVINDHSTDGTAEVVDRLAAASRSGAATQRGAGEVVRQAHHDEAVSQCQPEPVEGQPTVSRSGATEATAERPHVRHPEPVEGQTMVRQAQHDAFPHGQPEALEGSSAADGQPEALEGPRAADGQPEALEGPDAASREPRGDVGPSAPTLRLLNLADYTGGKPLNSYKKKAIELAVGMSSGDLIVTTDADCQVPRQWLRQLAACRAQKQAVLVAAPVAFTNNGRFSGIFQCLDFMSLQGITAASVAAGFHSMCNGANLLYEKAAFLAVKGFAGIDHLASGDDMLLMHKLSTAYPGRIAFCYSPQAIVHTSPMPDWASFFNQRIRWASKTTHYRDKNMLAVLVLVYCYNLFLLLSPSLAFVAGPPWLLTWALLLATKTLVEWAFMWRIAQFLGGRQLLGWFPLMQPWHIVYTVVAGWLGKFGTYRWKGREVK